MKLRTTVHRIVALFALAIAAATPAAAKPHDGLPLGGSHLAEIRTTIDVAPGVTYTRIVRGSTSPSDVYSVDVSFQASHASAQALDRRLRSQGFAARIDRIDDRTPDDVRHGPLGYLVRVGAFATEAEATALRDRLAAQGYTGLRVVYTGEDGNRTTGPWVVHVLAIDPAHFHGTVGPELGTHIVPGKEQLSSIAGRTGALAAANGGYFVVGPNDGTPGDLAGISMIDGRLISEAVNGRTSLVLPEGSGRGAQIESLSSYESVRAQDGATREIDGLNRKPGLIRACGGVGGDQPTERPKHDFTCTDPGELILFTPDFGTTSEPGEGREVVVDATGTVREVRAQRGAAIPPDGAVLSATTDGAEWLAHHATVGTHLTIAEQIKTGSHSLPMSRGLGIVNGGPRLLRAGAIDITAAAEGFVWPDNPEFYYRFGIRRNPRTIAGVMPGGVLLLVAVDGHRPGYSVGASFLEEAQIMRALGARDAVNLDGGGSTTMTLGATVVNRPTDATGERPIGDAILIRP